MSTAVDDAPETTEEPVAGSGPTRRRLLVPILIGALVLAIMTAGMFAALWLRESETDPAEVSAYLSNEEGAVSETATEVITLLTNYDAANIDSVVSRMLEITTGSFRSDYNETFESGFAEAIKEASTSARGQIVSGPEISFRNSDEAVAVARVSQTIQNNQNPGGRSFVDVMQITLIQTSGGGWKADRVEILGAQES